MLCSRSWCVTRPIHQLPLNNQHPLAVFHATFDSIPENEKLDIYVENYLLNDSFWVRPDVKLPLSDDDHRAISILESTIKYVGYRYEVGVLWKNDPPNLPNNYPVAVK